MVVIQDLNEIVNKVVRLRTDETEKYIDIIGISVLDNTEYLIIRLVK